MKRDKYSADLVNRVEESKKLSIGDLGIHFVYNTVTLRLDSTGNDYVYSYSRGTTWMSHWFPISLDFTITDKCNK